MSTPVRVGLLDSGVAADLRPAVVLARRFWLDGDGVVRAGLAVPDRLGHGTALARIILGAAPDTLLLDAQVFTERLVTAPAVLAEGLRWVVAEGAQLVNVSAGLREDRRVLREACRAAADAGVILVAAAPARGPAVYPAAYPGVLRVTGDARCVAGEVSRLATAQADYGACPQPLDAGPVGGASFGVAHVAGLLAAYLAAGSERGLGAARRHLDALAHYHGPERRQSTHGGGSP